MKTAILKISPAEKLRFEVHSIPSHGHHSGVQKWYMKANHPVEASRWTQAIKKSIEWCKREMNTEKRRKSMESESSSTLPPPSTTATTATTTTRFTKRSVAFLRSKRRSESASISSSYLEPTPDGYVSEDLSSYLHDGGGPNASSGNELGENGDLDNDDGDGDDDDDSLEVNATAPHDTAFELHGNSTIAQMELTSQLLAGVIDSPDLAFRSSELRSGLQESFTIAQGLVNEYVRMAKERDAWWKVNLERERMNQSVWEESLASAVKDGEALEGELRNRSRRRGSRFFGDGGGGGGTVRQRPKVTSPTSSTRQIFLVPPPETPTGDALPSSVITPTPVTIPIMPTMSSEPDGDMQNDDIETDDEDEFFDAIESNTIPNLVVAKSLEQPGESECVLPPDANLQQYEGYKNLRTRLSIGNDERPSTSLWSVLKHSIGKDLTRISFPVFFNEPTSMLQRMVSLLSSVFCVS
jgi:hypothetical protein